MITTLTLNPAIDKTLILSDFAVNEVNRVQKLTVDAGGKGINASKIIQSLGEETIALGILGGQDGKLLEGLLDEKEIRHDFVWVSEKTRTNTKIVDIKQNTCTDINETGPFVGDEKLSELMEKIKIHAATSEILVLSGNAQSSIPQTIYKEIIEMLKAEHTKIILDASGSLLAEGMKANPWMIKPNIDELNEVLGTNMTTIPEIIDGCQQLIQNGISYVCVSMGADGLLLVSGEEAILATPPKIIAKSTVGAGDSVVGSLAVSTLRGENLADALKKACAISAACVTLEGTDTPSPTLVAQIFEDVNTKKYTIKEETK